MKWISVKDQLPLSEHDSFTSFEEVDVIAFEGQFAFWTTFQAGREPKYWSKFTDSDQLISHWMPLPDPPK